MVERSLPYTLVDVFTDTALAGNACAVVHEADDLDEATMLGFARETRLSETTFVQAPTRDGAHYRNRIWTIRGELPFAGHPSLGTAVAVARQRGDRRARYVQETGAGLQPIEVQVAGAHATATMAQAPASFGDRLDAAAVLATVGLEGDLAHPHLAPQVVSTGLPTLVALVAHPDAIAGAVPDWPALDALLAPLPTANLYLAWAGPDRGRARARLFTRAVAEGEDPATGSAAGPLCAYLDAGLGWSALEILQGVEMGRPSRLRAEVAPGGEVRVGGDVVTLIDGTLVLDS